MGEYYYPDQFTFETEVMPEMAGVLGIFVVVYLLIVFFMFAFSILSYVLQGVGLHTIANRRGIRNGWLAWIPLGNLWVLGSISDQYQYVTKGKIKNRRKVLLGLSIGYFAFCIIWMIAAVVGLLLTEGMDGEIVAGVLLILLGGLLMAAIAVAMLIYYYLCLYDLYNSCNPSNGVLFLVLSIVFSVTVPFFVFACRKRDSGMPPRKQPEPQQVVVPTVEVVVDPTVVEKVVVPTVEPVLEEGFASPEEFEEE
ncbi:MAG: hypothetical protein E7421_04290 [Ruminococcaceae bacterium]|nr:hypothetical protein [Oscillospiraceae bacterium]